MFTPLQLRAARVLAQWSRDDLARESGTARETIQNFEMRQSDPKRSTLLAWRTALQTAGVVFVDEDEHGGPGVRLPGLPGERGYRDSPRVRCRP
jgi:transcriptional regulator with XRE-family HTH domain